MGIQCGKLICEKNKKLKISCQTPIAITFLAVLFKKIYL
jgi:hypothetical protein